MRAICLIDTSIFVNILNIPNMNQEHVPITGELEQKINNNEGLFLPMATILETGNHIAQNGDGNQRRTRASLFSRQVELAIDGRSPFTPVNFLEADDLRRWLSEFPDWAMQERGLGDLSIVHDWERVRDQNQARRVYIWSLDGHLSAYDTSNR